jgi:phosphoserine aminotransferase
MLTKKRKMSRKLNFNAGPGAMPEEVLQQAADAVIEYNNSGLSILEISHRGSAFIEIIEESKLLVRELCGLSEEYEVMWLHGGGRMQFCMVPMNFLGMDDVAGYIDTDHWSHSALEYAKYYGHVQVLASSKDDNYNHLPLWPQNIPSHLAYLHYTSNNTIYGTQWPSVPKCNVPLIADMSSDILSAKRDYAHCDMFYAAAQKNIGPAGVTLAVMRKDMFQRIKRTLPSMLDYKAQAKENSILNTAPVFAIYTALLMLRWTKAKGIDNIEKENRQKAQVLYDEVERNTLFNLFVTNKQDRSLMNVCFIAVDLATEKKFLQFCEERNINGVKGHRSVGGFRVSLYNAVTMQATKQLVEAMKEFEKSYNG